MNRLSTQTSPYLLQHAHNPVDWQPWDEAALEQARRQGRPILLSIGYSTCHWCHVMERESFEDEATADVMNAHFVCIKVDREERPDLDQIYMDACQLQNGSGGWPLNCFLLPDGRPFFTGTYWPPRPAFNRPAWRQVLLHIAEIWKDKRHLAEEQAERLTAAVARTGGPPEPEGLWLEGGEGGTAAEALGKIMFALSQQFDRTDGGFGAAPKFPSTMGLRWLMAFHHFHGNGDALGHALFSLERMVSGGLFDQLGGGFARYATDAAWLVPHFEKMLYDNALLLSTLSDAYKISKKPLFREAIEATCEWIFREMSHPDGGFFSAQDADSEGVEGKFFVWRKEEVEAVLGSKASLLCDFFDISEAGNWEGENILNIPEPLAEFCERRGLDPNSTQKRLDAARQTLFAHRSKRVWPSLDNKCLLGWNALMASGLAHAFEATGLAEYRTRAEAALLFIKERMQRPDGGFLHTWKDGRAHIEAFLEDYAFLIAALLDVFETNHDMALVDEAERLAELVLREFFDEKTGFFFFAPAGRADLVARRHDLTDNATPSGNAVMAMNLQRLGHLLGRRDWLEAAHRMLAAMLGRVEKFPLAYGDWARAILFELSGRKELVVVGPEAFVRARQIGQLFLPGRILVASETGEGRLPLLEGRAAAGGGTLIYVCENNACRAPVETVEEAGLF